MDMTVLGIGWLISRWSHSKMLTPCRLPGLDAMLYDFPPGQLASTYPIASQRFMSPGQPSTVQPKDNLLLSSKTWHWAQPPWQIWFVGTLVPNTSSTSYSMKHLMCLFGGLGMQHQVMRKGILRVSSSQQQQTMSFDGSVRPGKARSRRQGNAVV